MEDSDIEPAPKLIEVVFQNCKGNVDQWVEPYLSLTIDRLRRAHKPYLKCLLVQVVRSLCFQILLIKWCFVSVAWDHFLRIIVSSLYDELVRAVALVTSKRRYLFCELVELYFF